ENFNNMALDFQNVAERAIAIIKKIEEAEGTVGKLISSDEIYVDAKDISEKINRITSKVESLTTDISEGKGTLGKLIKEDKVYTELEELSNQFKNLGEKLNKIADKIETSQGTVGKLINEDTIYLKAVETLDKTKIALTDISEITQKSKEIKIYLGASDMKNFEREENLTNAYLRIEPNTHKFYSIGLDMTSGRDITKKDRDTEIDLDLQIGYKFYNDRLTFRAGLFESRIGAGIDYKINDKTSCLLETRETYENEERIDNIRIRSYLEYNLYKNLYLRAGGDNLGSDACFWLGGKFEFEDKDLKYLITTIGIGQ
ncbi:MAG: hypothetical protein AB1765_08405, partial [Candidatus Hydrogenedentota bacterium]